MYFGIAGTIWSLRNSKNVIFLGSNDVNSRNPPPLVTVLRDTTILSDSTIAKLGSII